MIQQNIDYRLKEVVKNNQQIHSFLLFYVFYIQARQ